MSIHLHTVTGADLPELVWHHERADDGEQVSAQFRTPQFNGWTSKPDGGLWAAVRIDTAPSYLSAWGEFSRSAELRPEARFASRILPVPNDRFVVVDTEADAVAVAQAFPGATSVFSHLIQAGEQYGDMSALRQIEASYGDHPVPDLTLLSGRGYAGLWLTDRGLMATKHVFSTREGVPSFWGWDAETVWFGGPRMDVVDTRPWEPA